MTATYSGPVPTKCPCCGAYSLAPDEETVTLVAVCDVLVVKALERVGQFLLRGPDRTRYRQAEGHPTYTIHTLWQASDALTDRALRGAWDVVPALLDLHGCCGVTGVQVARVLNDYVHDLVLTGTPHTLGELEYRFVSRLGLPVIHDHAEEETWTPTT
jgi:hypothetical protein